MRRLRADGGMWLERIKPWRGVIAGYAALSRMRAPEGWACLAALAVLPRFQNAAESPNESVRGAYAIGTRLTKELVFCVEEVFPGWRAKGKDFPSTIVVLGKPSFYERAGFSLVRAAADFTLTDRPHPDRAARRRHSRRDPGLSACLWGLRA